MNNSSNLVVIGLPFPAGETHFVRSIQKHLSNFGRRLTKISTKGTAELTYATESISESRVGAANLSVRDLIPGSFQPKATVIG